jgi:parallel beta-helix repeat protein
LRATIDCIAAPPVRRSALTAAGLTAVAALTLLAISASSLKAAPTAAIDVRYTGARDIASDSVLTAAASSRGGRIAAVTFYVDGRPVGSDTTKPYTVDLLGGIAKPGLHHLRVVVVDSLARRRTSPTTRVTVRAARPWLRASPSSGLSRALRELAHGGRVKLAGGTYNLAQIRLASGARLVGSGTSTVIAAPAGAYSSLLTVSGRNIRIADLALDGGGAGAGAGNAIAVKPGSVDVRIQRATIRHIRSIGVHAWGGFAEVSVQDSVLAGDGRAESGVVAGESHPLESRDSSVIRSRISGFTDYGVNFVHIAHDDPDAALRSVALDNHITDINDPGRADGTNEGAIWSGGAQAAIIGNRIARTGWDGIETVGSSANVTIARNSINDTPVGIYVEHETTSSLITKNVISRVNTGINVEWAYGGVGSVANKFIANRISAAAKTGIFLDVGADQNHVLGNILSVSAGPAIVLQGSSKNLVRGNTLCRTTALVREQVGTWDNGQPAYPTGNTIAGNRTGAAC